MLKNSLADFLNISASGKIAMKLNENDKIIGGNGDNTIGGDLGDDVIYGKGGNDIIYGGFGDDILYGGFGNDELYGGYGRNIYMGSEGNDTIHGKSENVGGYSLDIALYNGKYSDYTITNVSDDTSYIADNRLLEGLDKLQYIDILEFSDGRYNLHTREFTQRTDLTLYEPSDDNNNITKISTYNLT